MVSSECSEVDLETLRQEFHGGGLATAQFGRVGQPLDVPSGAVEHDDLGLGFGVP